MNNQQLVSKIECLTAKANFNIRPDLKGLIEKAYKTQRNKKAKQALSWILENAKIAQKEKLAICQDTGLPVIFIECGKDIKLDLRLIDNIKKAVETGYAKNSLRPSIVDPLNRSKSSFKGVSCYIESVNSKNIKVTILPKGFGSENKSQLKMFNPTASIDDIEDFIISAVKNAGPESCPPFVIGVGIGGTSDKALFLAKKALIGRVDKPNKDHSLNLLEQRLLKKINKLNIGPMGLGGKNTALSVKILKQPTHIAGLPVGVNISCHALRSAALVIK